MSKLPYRWHPSGTRSTHTLEPGMLLPLEHKVWQVMEVRPVPQSELTEAELRAIGWKQPMYVRIREPGPMSVDPVANRRNNRHIKWNGSMVHVYPNAHYPICNECHEPRPCRDQMAEQVSGEAAKRMTRYELAGVCPACEEPVTARQLSKTWAENVEIIGGPPVTFHMRGGCHSAAVNYEKRWQAEAPDDRRCLLSCKGHVTNHGDGTYQCTEMAECPGPTADHPGYQTCQCPECPPPARGCCPSPGSTNRALNDSLFDGAA